MFVACGQVFFFAEPMLAASGQAFSLRAGEARG
jgi:hypothetical protein